MKRKQVTLAVLLAALSFFAAPSASALSQSDVQVIKKAVATVPAAEVAAKAAQLISEASKADRQEVALTTLRAVASTRPAALVAVVAAMAKVAPDVSAVVAAEAAKLSSDQASEIAKAAVTSAPGQAAKIAAAVAKETPVSATKVTRSVALIVPEQTNAIKEAVVASVPAAKTDLANDTTITRLSLRSSAAPGATGVITTRPGTIRGTPPPNVPPDEVTSPVPGADSARRYNQP
jgi:hypothetical protein